MKAMKQYFNSNWKSKKAFIFTMDVAITLAIVFLFLLAATSFVTKTSEDPFPNLQLVKFGTDVVRLLEYQGFFENPDQTAISNKLQSMLPSYYDMNLEGIGDGDCNFVVGNAPPEDQFISGGKYYFKTENNYCYVRYKLWGK